MIPSGLGEDLAARTEKRERILSTTLASMRDFAFVFDREGRFLFANQSLLTLWNVPLESVVGKTFAELGYPPELAEKLQGQVQDVCASGTTVTDETPYTDPSDA